MSDNQYEQRLREITRMFGENAPSQQVLVKGKLLKDDMTRHMNSVWMMLNTLDYLVATFAPKEPWQIGWSTDVLGTGTEVPKVAARQPRVRRVERTLEIARGFLTQGTRTVRTGQIADQLQAEGDVLRRADLNTAIGNILTRSGEWRRVAPGEYAPSEKEK